MFNVHLQGSNVSMFVPDRLHGLVLRDLDVEQPLQRQPLLERSDLHPAVALQLHLFMPSRMER